MGHSMPTQPGPVRRGVILDVDGTLVDTNYPHILAWWHAFRTIGRVVQMSELHQLVGMGADQLIPRVLGRPDEQVKRAHSHYYAPYLEQLVRLPRADEFVKAVAGLGLDVVLATSAQPEEVTKLVETLGAGDAVREVTSTEDVEHSKPAPDLITAALAKGGLAAECCLMVGDTPWDVTAAGQAGLGCIGVLSGGFSADLLRAAGAVAVYRDVAELLDQLGGSPIGALAAAATAGPAPR